MVKTKDNVFAAAKLFKEASNFNQELQILKKLNSPWTLKLFDSNESGKLAGNDNEIPSSLCDLKKKAFPYIVMELADNGEFFDYLDISGAVSEKVARYYFQNLINALEYLHIQGISHRDIKLENLLLTRDFNIKLADFGLAVSPESKMKHLSRGTIRYLFFENIKK